MSGRVQKSVQLFEGQVGIYMIAINSTELRLQLPRSGGGRRCDRNEELEKFPLFLFRVWLLWCN